jgi:hypothetical protein
VYWNRVCKSRINFFARLDAPLNMDGPLPLVCALCGAPTRILHTTLEELILLCSELEVRRLACVCALANMRYLCLHFHVWSLLLSPAVPLATRRGRRGGALRSCNR